jgi:hypothetical protein
VDDEALFERRLTAQELREAAAGLGRIIALFHRSSTWHQIR